MFISARSVAVFVVGMLVIIALGFGANLVQLSLPSSTSPRVAPTADQAREPALSQEPAASAATAPRALDHGRSVASEPPVEARPARAAPSADQTSVLPTEPGPRIYVPLTVPEQAVKADSSVPYPEKALVDLHYAFQKRDAAAMRELLSVQAEQQVLDTNSTLLSVFVATEGLLIIDGHTAVRSLVYEVPFRFELPSSRQGKTFEVAGSVLVRGTSAGRWYIDDLTLPQP